MRRTRSAARRPRHSKPSSPKPAPGASADEAEKILQRAYVLDISQDAIFCWRQPGGIEFWNKGATALYGYSEREALGKSSHKLLGTRFPDGLVSLADELRAHSSWQGELCRRTREGREIIVFARFQIVPQSGRGTLVLESARDISALKQNEQFLEGRLREQAVTARFSLDALKATNIQSICDDASDVLTRQLGVGLSSLWESSLDGTRLRLRSGSGWRPGLVGIAEIGVDERTPAGRALHLERTIVIEDARADRLLRLPEFMRRHKIMSSVAVVIQGRKSPFGVLVISHVTAHVFSANEIRFIESISNVLATAVARIHFEQELRETSARLKGVVDTAVDGIITISEHGIVETMNPAAERIFGYDSAEVVGRNVSMLMPEPYRSEHDGYLDHYHKTGERRIIGIGREVRGRRKDGKEFPMDLAVSATTVGQLRIFTGLVRDITNRKRLEQEILEISDHEQRRIGSDLHDDLCQRLAGIRFSCDALKNSLGTINPEDVLQRVEKIAGGVSEAIERTRMLARGLSPVALESNGLLSALQELTDGVRQLFGIDCTFKSKGKIEVTNPTVAMHLYRITQEAINNALKHAQPGKLRVVLESAGDKGRLTIRDNGAGFSGDRRNTDGMGLRTIAYRAGLIGAYLDVQSTPGHGTSILCIFSPNE